MGCRQHKCENLRLEIKGANRHNRLETSAPEFHNTRSIMRLAQTVKTRGGIMGGGVGGPFKYRPPSDMSSWNSVGKLVLIMAATSWLTKSNSSRGSSSWVAIASFWLGRAMSSTVMLDVQLCSQNYVLNATHLSANMCHMEKSWFLTGPSI